MAPFSTCWYPSVTVAAAKDAVSMNNGLDGGHICQSQSDVTAILVDDRSVYNTDDKIDEKNKIEMNKFISGTVLVPVKVGGAEKKKIEINKHTAGTVLVPVKGGGAKEKEAKDFHTAINRIKVEMILSLYPKTPQQP